VKEAIAAAKKLSIQQGAELKYNANVIAVDHKTCTVTLENGEVYKAKNLVITCGAITD
jgi:thioredoxin reductase